VVSRNAADGAAPGLIEILVFTALLAIAIEEAFMLSSTGVGYNAPMDLMPREKPAS